jgi:CubicO group peptidase (beta-lactamase class C family)
MVPCFLLGALLGVATPAGSPVPAAHTFSAAMARTIDDIGVRTIRDGRAPGLAIGVVEDGRVVYARGFGYADTTTHDGFDPSTQTYTGEVTRPFTAAAILLLEQDGKLKLDDKISKYIPELTVGKDVTIEQLLHQTSGLPELTHGAGMPQAMFRTIKPDDFFAEINKSMPLAQPGTKYRVNDINYKLAGIIVERASGVPLSDYLQQHVFIPLVMNQTFLAGDTGISPDAAHGYTGSPHHFAATKTYDPAWLAGNADLVTNVYDLAKWDIGMPLLLRVDAVREMFTTSSVNGALYGLGWTIDERGGKRYVWQNGEIPGYHAMNAMLPDDHIAVIVLSNTDAERSAAVISPEAMAAHILDIVAPPVTAHVESAIVERARDWLERLADHQIDRTQLTPAFSAYLTDDLIAKSNFASLGKVQTIVPIASEAAPGGGTVYEFLVRFAHEQDHYRFSVTKDGKIDGLVLRP